MNRFLQSIFFLIACIGYGHYVYVPRSPNNHAISVIDITTNTVVGTISIATAQISALTNSPSDAFLYTSGYTTLAVNVIATSTNTIEATANTGNNPIQSAITPNGSFLYVPNYGENNVSVIDTSTNLRIATVAVGVGGGGSHPVTPVASNSYVYVPNSTQNNIGIISVSSQTLLSNLNTGSNPNKPIITPDYSYVYVPNLGEPSLTIISTASNTLSGTVTLTGNPGIPAVTPNGALVYVPCSDNSVNVFSVSNPGSVQRIPVTNAGSLAISFDGNFVYVAGNGGTTGVVSVIATANNEVVTTILVGHNPQTPVITIDDALVYVSNNSDGTVSVIDTSKNQVISTINVGGSPLAATIVMVAPPIALKGWQTRDQFLSEVELVNILTWEPPLAIGPQPIQYLIYRDINQTDLAAIVPATDPLEFEDHNRKNNTNYTYYVISQTSGGVESYAKIVTILP